MLKSVFIEVNDDFEEQSHQVQTIMESAGFKLKEKRQSEMLDGNAQFGRTYNQIWLKCNKASHNQRVIWLLLLLYYFSVLSVR